MAIGIVRENEDDASNGQCLTFEELWADEIDGGGDLTVTEQVIGQSFWRDSSWPSDRLCWYWYNEIGPHYIFPGWNHLRDITGALTELNIFYQPYPHVLHLVVPVGLRISLNGVSIRVVSNSPAVGRFGLDVGSYIQFGTNNDEIRIGMEPSLALDEWMTHQTNQFFA